MKKYIISFLVLSSIFQLGVSQVSNKSHISLFQEVKAFNWKTSDGLPYVRDFTGSYSVEVFKQLDNNRFAFLSKSEQTILIFNVATGQKENTIYLPFFPIDFTYADNQFFVAGTENLFVVNAGGKIIDKWFFGDKINFVDAMQVVGNQVYLISSDQRTWWFDKSRKHIINHDGIILKKDFFGKVAKQGKHQFLISLTGKGSESIYKTVTEEKSLGTIRLLGMSKNLLFVEVQTVLNPVPLQVKRQIRAYKITENQIIQFFSVPLPDLYYTYIKHDVMVSDGKIDVLVATPEKARLYKLTDFDEAKIQNQIYLPNQLYGRTYHYNNHLLPAGNRKTENQESRNRAPITRQQIISNAEPYATYQWYCNSINIKDYDCGGVHVTTPSWVTVGNNVAVPYMWGGFSSLPQFDQGLLDGVSAGDSYTVGSGSGSSCAVGVDCSGFVSRAWDLPTKYGTSTLPNISTAYSSFDELLPGDIVNYAGSHVRLIHTVNGSGSFLIIEASGTGTDWRVGYNNYTTADLQANYIPRYYVDVINDPPDTINPTTTISANVWETTDFQVNFTDDDNTTINDRFYQVCYFAGSAWFANNDNGFLNENFSIGISSQWTMLNGSWGIISGALNQTDETNTNTNFYAPLQQTTGNTYLYHWKMKIDGSGTNRRAGMYFMVDDPTMTQRNNAYMVYFRVDQNTCQIYKSVNDVIDLKTDDACQVDSSVWFDAKVIYNTNTGEIKVFKDNVLVSSWIDTSPLTTGNSISLRTGEANVSYDDIKVYRSRLTTASVTVGTNADVPFQNFSPLQPACLILSVVTDSANNFSDIDSAFVGIDTTQPDNINIVEDGLSSDIDTTFDATQLSANWTISLDDNSDISAYFYCIGSTPGADDAVPWINNGNTTIFTETGLSLSYGNIYYVSVAAMNGAGLMSDTTISDGILLLNPSFISENGNSEEDFTIYPVPANDVIWVFVKSKKNTTQPGIFDYSGKQVSVAITKVSAGLWQVNLKTLAGGMYFVRVKTQTGYSSRKFSITK